MNNENKPINPEQPQEEVKKTSFMAWLRSCFFTGIFALAPVVITFYLIRFAVGLLNGIATSFFPEKYAPSNYLPYDIPGFELLLGFILLIIIGAFVKNYFGAKLLNWSESLLTSIPGVSSIYNTVKQVIDTVTTSNSSSFREVVLVEYPRKDLWAIAFVTGKTKGEVQRITDDELINVFIPTTPNPTSGFLLFVPKKDIRPLHMTVDQGIKMVISAGIVTPTSAEGFDQLYKEQHTNDKEMERLVVDKVSKKDVKAAEKRTAARLDAEAKENKDN